MRWLWLALAMGCHGDGASDWVVSATGAASPAVVLLATLDAEGKVEVGGVVSGELWIDVDDLEDQDHGFRAVVQDANGETLYARSQMGPLQVRDYLGYYGDETGYDILAAFPMLGEFPIQVPLLDGAEYVSLQVREGTDTDYVEVGTYDLDRLTVDEQGTAASVTGSALLHDAGPSENRLDIVLMGDGYTEAQMSDWVADAELLADELIGTEPLAGLAGFINIHRIDAVSAESGISYDCVESCTMLDTAFQSVFALNWVNSLIGTDYSTRAIFQIDQWEVARAASVVPWDVVVIVGNSEAYGGMAVHYATVTNGPDTWRFTGVHELAHVLGALGDEYVSDACIVSDGNGLPVNVTDDPESPSWSHWIDEGTPLPTPATSSYEDVVGAFRGAFNCNGLFRPADECRMNDSESGEFCAVCTEQLSRRVFRFADPADGLDVRDDGDDWCFTADSPQTGLGLVVSRDGQELATGTDTVCLPKSEAEGTLSIDVALSLDAVLQQDGELDQRFTARLP